MPVVYHQFEGRQNDNRHGYTEAKELAKETVRLYGYIRNVHVGIGCGSCCAAIAIKHIGNLYSTNHGLPFSMILGNSRLAPSGLASAGYKNSQRIRFGGHAERAAFTVGEKDHPELYTIQHLPGNQAVLYVELHPCTACKRWLEGTNYSPRGIQNPFKNEINAQGQTTLNVWYRWPHKDNGVAQMEVFHGLPLEHQLLLINNW